MINKIIALSYGLISLLLFFISVGMMIYSLFFGLQNGQGSFEEMSASIVNTLLILQFPLFHSYFLSRKGEKVMVRMIGRDLGSDLKTTTYVLLSSCQLFITFYFWSPSNIVLWEATGNWYYFFCSLYLLSWLLLGKSMQDAGLDIQMGYLGWASVLKGERPQFKPFEPCGFFTFLRQPVYVTFSFTLWTAPTLTLDRLILAIGWTLYCIIGPKLKEERYKLYYGAKFEEYKKKVPYWIPILSATHKDENNKNK